MKKIIFLLLISSTIFFIACNTNKAKGIVVNKWRIINIDMPDMPLPDTVKNAAMKGITEFKKDGKWSVTGMGHDQSGTYTLSDDGTTIFIISDSGTETNKIVELTKSKLILYDSANNSRVTFVPR